MNSSHRPKSASTARSRVCREFDVPRCVMPGERHGDDTLEGFAKHTRPARMGDAVGSARHENVGDDVECAQAGPQRQRGHDFTFFGDCVDDPAEQDRLGDGHHGQHDIGDADGGDASPVRQRDSEAPSSRFRAMTRNYLVIENCAPHHQRRYEPPQRRTMPNSLLRSDLSNKKLLRPVTCCDRVTI